jgi:hypothetical protein
VSTGDGQRVLRDRLSTRIRPTVTIYRGKGCLW